MTLVGLVPHPDRSLLGRLLQVAFAATAGVGLARLVTADCANYLSRADVLTAVAVLTVTIGSSIWSALGDTDTHRVVGLVAVGSFVGILTPTLPLPAAAILLCGAARRPRTRSALVVGAVLAFLGVLVAWELPLAAQRLMQSSDFLCR